jgi:hypothetical protein
MPVRIIKQNRRSVTGVLNDNCDLQGTNAESSLEINFFKIARFDFDITNVEEQPFKLEFINSLGKVSRYCPDALLDHILPEKKAILSEVKYIDDLVEKCVDYKEKFAAAKRFALENNMIYKVFSEHDIKSPYLDNVRFFRKYRNREADFDYENAVKNIVNTTVGVTPSEVIVHLCQKAYDQDRVKRSLWRMISLGTISCDFMKIVTMTTELFSPKNVPFIGYFTNLNCDVFSKKTSETLVEKGAIYNL